jgi:hypothetical protein
MGKRELVLIVGFILAGAVIYQLTAPPPKPGQEGLWAAVTRGWQEIKADIAEHRSSATARNTTTAPVTAATKDLRIAELRGQLTVMGEDRADVAVELETQGYATTEEEARATAKRIVAELRDVSGSLTATVLVPRGTRRYRADMTIRVPRTLPVQLEVINGPLEVRNVARLRFTAIRSKCSIRDVAGEVRGEARDGDLEVVRARSVNVVGRRTEAQLERIEGDVTLELTDADLELREVTGDVRIEGRRLDMRAADIRGATRINQIDGEIRLDRITNPVDIEGNRSRVGLRLERPVRLNVATTEDTIELTLPERGGMTIDAVAVDGHIRTDVGDIHVATEHVEQRARGAVAGGGPVASLRATRGSITIRKVTKSGAQQPTN